MPDPDESAKKQNGRPSFQPSDAERDLARGLAADGSDDPAIAEALDISLPTLRKYFAAELAEARAALAPGLFGDGTAGEPAPAQATPAPSPARKRGRPRYQPTSADRDRVRMLAASGISEPIIARRLNISVPTLARAHADDLAGAREMAKAEIVEQLHRQMRAGSTSAAEKLRNLVDEADLASLAARRSALPVEAKTPEKETLGKKVQQARAAEKAGSTGKWAQLSQRSVQ